MSPALDLTLPAIDELAALGARFVCWRWETRDGRRTKPPINPHTGGYADSTDPATWSDLGTAMAAVERYQLDGVGPVLDANHDGIVGTDLDGCRDASTGKIADWAARIIRNINSYTEISPSGTGAKIYCRADPVPKLTANKRTVGKANGAKAPAVEVYTSGRYFCLTGQLVDGVPDEICDSTEALERLAAWIARGKPAPELPAVFAAMLESDAQLREAWETGAKIGQGGDTSASGLDWSLARHLRPHLDDADLEAVLRCYQHGQIGSGRLKGKTAERRITRILDELGERPKAKAEPPIPIFYTEADLADLELPIPQYVIHEILTVGLYILAASPKLGKSWLNLAAGRAVATGALFGGSRRVRQGPVLFLDLEGNQRRAQKRSALLRDGAAPSPHFHMIHTWPPMQAGGLELLERAIVAKGAILAMIDVWACFRPPRPKNADPYQWDHESAKLVQEVAHRTNCAIVITHHNRKAEAEDFTAQVSGTAGLTGAADGIITLSRKRGEADAVMKATGRDIEEHELALSFKDGKWTILGEAADVLMSKTRQLIHSTLSFAGKPMRPAEVAEVLGLKQEHVRKTLGRMLQDGTVKADTSGRYTPAEPGHMQ